MKKNETELTTAAAALGRKGGSAKSEAKTAAARENAKKGGRPPYTWMLVRKISGIPVSRHTSRDLASAAYDRWAQPEIDPLEVREYSAGYWKQMH